MTTSAAPRCSFPVCKSPTRHESGRCSYHRKPTGPPPLDGSWASGYGLMHPTGGYDEMVKRTTYTAYAKSDVLHRIDGPAYLMFREPFHGYGVRPLSSRGKKALGVSVEEWFRDDVHHRNGGAAVTHFYPDLITRSKVRFYEDGCLHRIDGPALTDYSKGGSVNREVYAIAGSVVAESTYAEALSAYFGGAPIEWIRAFAEGIQV